MTNDVGNPKPEGRKPRRARYWQTRMQLGGFPAMPVRFAMRNSSFDIRHCFVIRHSSFVIGLCLWLILVASPAARVRATDFEVQFREGLATYRLGDYAD